MFGEENEWKGKVYLNLSLVWEFFKRAKKMEDYRVTPPQNPPYTNFYDHLYVSPEIKDFKQL